MATISSKYLEVACRQRKKYRCQIHGSDTHMDRAIIRFKSKFTLCLTQTMDIMWGTPVRGTLELKSRKYAVSSQLNLLSIAFANRPPMY
eukprot:IDg19288t1